RIPVHFGGKADHNSISDILLKRPSNGVNDQNWEFLSLGIGGFGGLKVSVTRGDSQVNVSTIYGLSAGSLTVAESETQNGEQIKDITQPLVDKYVKPIEEKDGGDGTLIVVAGEERDGTLVINKSGHLSVGSLSGYKLGAFTTVSKRG
ncbi:unnamed protein product, partial [Oppiella nova]